jgi:hypothetical protein
VAVTIDPVMAHVGSGLDLTPFLTCQQLTEDSVLCRQLCSDHQKIEGYIHIYKVRGFLKRAREEVKL